MEGAASTSKVERGGPSRVGSEPQILVFQGKSDCLSNMFPCVIRAGGKKHKSSEHLYQYTRAMYLGRPDLADQVLQAKNGFDTKRICKSIREDPRWKKVQVEEMRKILALKAKQVPAFRMKLLGARDCILAEAVGL